LILKATKYNSNYSVCVILFKNIFLSTVEFLFDGPSQNSNPGRSIDLPGFSCFY